MARRIGDHRSLAQGLFSKPAADDPEPAAPQEPLTVSALADRIQRTLEQGVGQVLVIGEVSNARCVSGHWYFSIKDAESRIDCMMFRSTADRSTVKPVDGGSLLIRGTVTHYKPQGRTQIQVSQLAHAGAGDLDARFRELCDELRALGYFDESAKVPLPAVPMCIALVTSAGSAAEHDCFHAAASSFPATRILAVDVRVQGSGAAAAIANAIAAVDEAAPTLGIEVILLVRGGGSREDLWSFNERVVADAIFACRTPVVTGIGHESDTTIADLVADFRAPTPSRAITETLADRAALHEQTSALARRLARAQGALLERAAARIHAAARARAVSDPAGVIAVQMGRVSALAVALGGTMSAWLGRQLAHTQSRSARLARHHPLQRLSAQQARVEATGSMLSRVLDASLMRASAAIDSASRTLEAVGPAAVFRRGFSLTLRSDGTAVRSVHEIDEGSQIETVLADGSIQSAVKSKQPNAPAATVVPPPPAPSTRRLPS